MAAPFTQTAETIYELLNPGNWPDQDFGPTIDQASDSISHIKLGVSEWREVAAYLALQLRSARATDGRDERLLIHNLETRIREFREGERVRLADAALIGATEEV